jgi:20S proteasome alpha/beta subunit
LLHALREERATFEEEMAPKSPHKHTAVVKHELRQRRGVPYEVEITVCSTCDRVLDDRPVKRAAA